MRTPNLPLKPSLSMNSAARRAIWKASLPLLFLALLVYVLSQPMQAGRFGFATHAAFASWSANKAVIGGDIAQSNTCSPPPAGLVSRWAGEGNANDLGDGNHGQLESGTGYAAGFVGRAFSFDGTGEVRVASNANLNVQTFTIEAWVYPSPLDGIFESIVCKELISASQYQYYVAIRGSDNSAGVGAIPRGNLAFYLTGIRGLPDQLGGWVDGGGQVPLFTWTHVAVTFDGSSAKAYTNGMLTRNITGLTGNIPVTSGPLKIGSRVSAVSSREGFNGLIDEVAFYNRALSASEIQSIFNAGKLGKCSVTNVSAASFSGQSLTNDSIAAAFGADLATGTRLAPPVLPLPTELGGTRVLIGGIPAGLFFVSPAQVNFHMPPGMAAGAASVAVTNANSLVSYGAPQIASVAPGLFSANADGQGVAAAVVFRRKANGMESFEPVARYDSGQNKFVAVPIDLSPESDQIFLILYGTGFRNRSALSAVTTTIGGTNSETLFASEAPGFVGLDQANVRLSRSLIGRGEVDVALTVDGKMANLVRVNIK